MKILLDECITKTLKKHLVNYTVYTVADMNWLGMKNGNLMKSAIAEGFDILLTIDKNLQFQNNIKEYDITIIIFDSHNSKLETLLHFIPILEKQIINLKKGKVYLFS